MRAASPVRRTSLVLTVLAAVQAAAVGVLAIKAYPKDPFADPHGPLELFIALLFFLLAGGDLFAAVTGALWTRREAPLLGRSRFAWMVWVVFAAMTNAASLALLIGIAAYRS